MIFERHWMTQRLIDAFVALPIGAKISLDEIAASCGIAADVIRRRARSAKRAALHEHHVIIDSIRGFGFERLPQDVADVPARRYLVGARNKARRATNVFEHGITDWNQIERSKKNEMFVTQAAAAAIVQATSPDSRRRLARAVETANTKLDFGRTLDLLRRS